MSSSTASGISILLILLNIIMLKRRRMRITTIQGKKIIRSPKFTAPNCDLILGLRDYRLIPIQEHELIYNGP